MIELALPPNRPLPDLVVRIELQGSRNAGYAIPGVNRVVGVVPGEGARIYTMPGGGWELQFPYAIPPEYLELSQ